jgi:hypothetical protein
LGREGTLAKRTNVTIETDEQARVPRAHRGYPGAPAGGTAGVAPWEVRAEKRPPAAETTPKKKRKAS